MYELMPRFACAHLRARQDGKLAAIQLNWGFPLDGKPNAVLNARIESALELLRRGRRGMWTKAIEYGRCLVPVRVFCESSATEKVPSKVTGKPVRRSVPLLSARHPCVPAGRHTAGRQALNRHHRAHPRPYAPRPRIWRPGIWLGSDFVTLTDRSRLRLDATPER